MKSDIPAGTTWRDLTVPWPVQQQQPAQTPMKPLQRRRPPALWWASLTAGTSGTPRLPVTQPQAVRRRMGRDELVRRRRRREAMAKRRYVLRNRVRRLIREWGPGLVLVAVVIAVVVTMVAGLAVELRWLGHQVAALVAGGA